MYLSLFIELEALAETTKDREASAIRARGLRVIWFIASSLI
jgi:hypothetical protein